MAGDDNAPHAKGVGLGNLGFMSRGISLAVLLLIAQGCDDGPDSPPKLSGFSPVIASVDADEAIKLRVVYEENDYSLERFLWAAEAGGIDGNGQPEITYTAPAIPGDYRVSVTVSYGNNEPDLSLETEVRVLSADGAEEAPASNPGTPPVTEPSQQLAHRSDGTAVTPPATPTTAPSSGEPDETPSEVVPREQAALAEPAIAGADVAASRIDMIRARGRLDAIVQIEFAPFSFYGEDGNRVGFDIDLARELAKRWLDDPMAVRFVPVPTDTRIADLLRGEGDVIVAALTNTPERRTQIDFSATYFMDGQRLLIPDGSEIVDVCGLEGKKTAVIDGSTSLENLKQEASVCGFDITTDLVEFRRHADAVEALLSGEVAAFTSDGIALDRFADEQPLKVVGNHFSEEPYGIGLPKGDEDFQDLVDATLAAMQEDGTFARIYKQWFGDALDPYPLRINAPADQVAALVRSNTATTDQPVTDTDELGTAYVVKPGDTLSKIAGRLWGDVSPSSWQKIYEANKAVIGDNPSLIEVGMSLTIPAR
ncbi:MAG: transporter substrate-binding domain-containing protein [Pseudomonadota bacterium]